MPLALLGNVLVTFVLVRFGLLAYLFNYLFGSVLWSAVYTSDLSAWYMGRSRLNVAIVAALAIFAFRISLAGRPLFAKDLFEVEVEGKA